MRRLKHWTIALVGVCLLLPVGLLNAQGGLDYSLPPTAGAVTLAAGFTPDPHEIVITNAGGAVDVSEALGESCAGAANGFVAAAPDVRLLYTAGEYVLNIALAGDADAVLVISTPDGGWICDDDSGGLGQPAVLFDAPQNGQYDIWVGTYEAGTTVSGTLLISETDLLVAADFPELITAPAVTVKAGALPEHMPAAFGTIELASGFTEDPLILGMTAGGPVAVQDVLGEGSCAGLASGFIAAKPGYHVDYTAGDYVLRFFTFNLGDADPVLDALDPADFTLVVRAPDGSYFCDDDGAGLLQPLIEFDAPESGVYEVWVGVFMPDDYRRGYLAITETELTAQDLADQLAGVQASVDAGLDYALAPTYGEVALEAGFTPDPHALAMQAGGAVDIAAVLGETCDGPAAGYAASAPDYRLIYRAGDNTLRLFFNGEGGGDTTLVVNTPDGRWYCSDDAEGTLSGMVVFEEPISGQYDIWVGTFEPDTYIDGTLTITETGLTPATVAGGG